MSSTNVGKAGERASERAMREASSEVGGTTGVGQPTNQPFDQDAESHRPTHDYTATHADRLRELADILDNLPAGLLPAGWNIQSRTVYIITTSPAQWLEKAKALGADTDEHTLDTGIPTVRLNAGYWDITLIAGFAQRAERIELDYQHG